MAPSPELTYILLVFGLFIVPRMLQRFRVPGAITCVGIGALAHIVFDAFEYDSTIRVFSTLGIVSMFLFAGLEIDFQELKQGRTILLQHVGIQLALVLAGAGCVMFLAHLSFRGAVLFALALLTPSTGFIIEGVAALGLSHPERYWVKSKAIASEVVALAVLFLAVHAEDPLKLALSALALALMIVLLRPAFRLFSRTIAPYAPKMEFTFLVIIALLCAYLTRTLGVYYLIGAFVVGITAVRLRAVAPEFSSDRLLGSVEMFASFFIPFYFFQAGLHLTTDHFAPEVLLVAAGLLVVVLPVRILRVALHRRFALGETLRQGARIGTAVVPTLVFTMVIAGILREEFALPATLYGALMIFALVNTILPGLVLRVPPPDYEHPASPRRGEGKT